MGFAEVLNDLGGFVVEVGVFGGDGFELGIVVMNPIDKADG
ncbi:hypothetical protein [Geitlerinema sp. P-1104]|nr:hypothetical protein [Geitlerinema sp. P-1104]